MCCGDCSTLPVLPPWAVHCGLPCDFWGNAIGHASTYCDLTDVKPFDDETVTPPRGGRLSLFCDKKKRSNFCGYCIADHASLRLSGTRWPSVQAGGTRTATCESARSASL